MKRAGYLSIYTIFCKSDSFFFKYATHDLYKLKTKKNTHKFHILQEDTS